MSFITEPKTIRRILEHLDIQTVRSHAPPNFNLDEHSSKTARFHFEFQPLVPAFPARPTRHSQSRTRTPSRSSTHNAFSTSPNDVGRGLETTLLPRFSAHAFGSLMRMQLRNLARPRPRRHLQRVDLRKLQRREERLRARALGKHLRFPHEVGLFIFNVILRTPNPTIRFDAGMNSSGDPWYIDDDEIRGNP